MNKITLSAALSALFVSSVSFAADIPNNGLVTPAQCATLGSEVTLNLSANVLGAFSCNVTGNAMAVSTCHTSGSRSSRVYACTVIGQDEDDVDIYNNPGACPDGDGSVAADDGNFTIAADFVGFVASTTGGGVGAVALQGACDSTRVNALLPF